jgi:dihydrolipoamide dehydrogenase
MLLHIAKLIRDTKKLELNGINFHQPSINLSKMEARKNHIVNKISMGIKAMAASRKISLVNAIGEFTNCNTVVARSNNDTSLIKFDKAIIATGSHPAMLPFLQQNDPRIWNSTDALELREVPARMLIIGGGIIGLEIATIYSALGSIIDVIEESDQIIPSVDRDVAGVLSKTFKNKFSLFLRTTVTQVSIQEDGLYAYVSSKGGDTQQKRYDVLLVAVGRKPNSDNLGIDIKTSSAGFIEIDKNMQTNIPGIYAVGDVVGQPMLAHKGIYEGRTVAEIISGYRHSSEPINIPSVAYTDPELAWVGVTEKIAKERRIPHKVAIFPWRASGRAISSNCDNGITKLIFHTETRRIIGGAIVGDHAGELLGEIGLAIEMGCDAEDIAMTIHSHPTLSESIGLAAEVFEGTITDLPKQE